jgi:hypothetical protein
VGQDEVDIVRAADAVCVVLVPGMGDDIQGHSRQGSWRSRPLVINRPTVSAPIAWPPTWRRCSRSLPSARPQASYPASRSPCRTRG